MRRLTPIIILVIALVVGIWLGWKEPSEPLGAALRVDFINVGQGDSIFIRTPDGTNVLIDAGEAEYGPKVVAHLRRLGVRKLDLVVMSHPHSDHIGGMPAVFEAFPTDAVLDSGYAHGTITQERVLRTIEKNKIRYHRAKRGMKFRFGEDTEFEVLAPGEELLEGTSSDVNNNSVVLRLVYGDVRMLFTGDIEAEGEAQLIAGRADLASQVLKVAHHGSSDSASLEFLRLVRPSYVVLCVGEKNAYGHPSKATLKRLATKHTGAEILRTDKNGTITMHTDGRRIVVETQR